MSEAPNSKLPCPNHCGYLNAPDATFCAGCGAALHRAALDPVQYARQPRPALAAEIRALALGSLIGGLVALYFGFNLLPTPVAGASEEANRLWLGIDQSALILLKVVGAALCLAAAVCMTGNRVAITLVLLAEAGASIAFTGYGVVQLVKWGSLGMMTIAFLIVGVMSMAALVQAWRLYQAARRSASPTD